MCSRNMPNGMRGKATTSASSHGFLVHLICRIGDNLGRILAGSQEIGIHVEAVQSSRGRRRDWHQDRDKETSALRRRGAADGEVIQGRINLSAQRKTKRTITHRLQIPVPPAHVPVWMCPGSVQGRAALVSGWHHPLDSSPSESNAISALWTTTNMTDAAMIPIINISIVCYLLSS